MTKTSLCAPMLVALALAACVRSGPVRTTFDPPYPERNGVGEPILGVFFGRIPCAIKACEMRKVELVLYGSEQVPTTYWLGQVGSGVGNGWVVQQGKWAGQRGVRGYPDALVYALDTNADPSLRYLWRVNDEILLVLDPDLGPRAGTGAWGFMLSRDCAPYGPRTYAYDGRAKRFIAPKSADSSCPRPTATN
jgi:hypothetical protein